MVLLLGMSRRLHLMEVLRWIQQPRGLVHRVPDQLVPFQLKVPMLRQVRLQQGQGRLLGVLKHKPRDLCQIPPRHLVYRLRPPRDPTSEQRGLPEYLSAVFHRHQMVDPKSTPPPDPQDQLNHVPTRFDLVYSPCRLSHANNIHNTRVLLDMLSNRSLIRNHPKLRSSCMSLGEITPGIILSSGSLVF